MRAWRRRSSSAARAELGARGEGGVKGSAGGVKAERVRLAAGRAPLQACQRAAWSELAGRVGAVSGCGCRVAGDAGAESPRGGIPLPRSRRGAATGARVRASGRKSRRAGLGWGAVGRRGRSVRRAGGRLAGPASAVGPEARRWPVKEKNEDFQFKFSRDFQFQFFKSHFEQENDIF